MSYIGKDPAQITPGTAYEAFEWGVTSPMFPHEPYTHRASGPPFLAMDGAWGPAATPPPTLRGMGLDLSTLDPTGGMVKQELEKYMDQIIQGAINRNWPIFESKLEKSLEPVKLLIGATAALAGAAAVFSFLAYRK